MASTVGTIEDTQSLIESLQSEVTVLQEKLAGKCAAGTILARDLDQCRQDRDQFRIMLEQLRDNGRFKGSVDWSYATSNSALQHQLTVMRNRCQYLEQQVQELNQKIDEMSQDLKLLRTAGRSRRVSLSNNISATTDHSDNIDDSQHNADILVQLENSQRQYIQAQSDVDQLSCEKEELLSERRALRLKLHRLNHQLSCALKSPQSCHSSSTVDIDALICENRHLKPMLMLAEEEVERLNRANIKYKKVLQKESRSELPNSDGPIGRSVIATKKQVSDLLRSLSVESADSVAELKSLCTAMLEQLDDKCTALAHQKRTCRLLAEYNGHLRSMLEKHGLCVDPANLLMKGYEEPSKEESETDNKNVALSLSPCKRDSITFGAGYEKEEDNRTVQDSSASLDKLRDSDFGNNGIIDESERKDDKTNGIHTVFTGFCRLSEDCIDGEPPDCGSTLEYVEDSNDPVPSSHGERAVSPKLANDLSLELSGKNSDRSCEVSREHDLSCDG